MASLRLGVNRIPKITITSKIKIKKNVVTPGLNRSWQNDSGAQFNLGVCYWNGTGLTKDPVQAYKWWIRAAAQGNESAREEMTKQRVNISDEQMAEARKLASQFTPPESDWELLE